MKDYIPVIKVPIIKKNNTEIIPLNLEFKEKKILLFAVPGAFTPTCSEQHFPEYIKLYDKFKAKGIDEIYCLSVNDKHVMKSWLISYSENHNIIGIADGFGNSENKKINSHEQIKLNQWFLEKLNNDKNR